MKVRIVITCTHLYAASFFMYSSSAFMLTLVFILVVNANTFNVKTCISYEYTGDRKM